MSDELRASCSALYSMPHQPQTRVGQFVERGCALDVNAWQTEPADRFYHEVVVALRSLHKLADQQLPFRRRFCETAFPVDARLKEPVAGGEPHGPDRIEVQRRHRFGP